MTDPLKWFVAEALYQANVHAEPTDGRRLTEDLLFLVQASDHQSAVCKAETIARRKEHGYENARGEAVKWTFVRLVELNEMIEQQFEEGVELKSTIKDLRVNGAPWGPNAWLSV